ncbi:hypothetical protein HPP92_024922 [Vanilla planifolia]|uniref:Root UVB sensitive protein C-terminal domain-containing protein n=1 Tax=Vanilla planifolia TaxID=51239 RepID=A0A835PKK0_VANPL|nr:hypothetical protein HPP92_024922 [Vanilla planifolia]
MAKVSVMEHVLPVWSNPWKSTSRKLLHRHVVLGVKVSSLSHQEMLELSRSAATNYRKVKYLLLERKGYVCVVIHKQSTPADVLQSFIHALVLASFIEKNQSVHAESNLWIEENYNRFITKLRSAGWAVERLLTPSIVWKADWVYSEAELKIN